MALAHASGSFDYKVINENIRKILDTRSQLNNIVQVGMPFVKATTTIAHTEYLGDGNKGFTLGLHGITEDVQYADMYSDSNGTDPLIGYTYTQNGSVKKIYAKSPNSEVYKTAGNILDKQSTVVTYPENSTFIRIPPPGITNVTVGRNKNGLLAVAQLQISIPSLIQLESLHRTFLVPGVGMVLEWGQLFAPYKENEKYLQLTDIPKMFPWHNHAELDKMITLLAKREFGLNTILDEYVYPSNGQYMWMFGRVATFDVKANSDGSFSSTVKIVGPSEDAWAYSTRNTIVPSKPKNSPVFCGSDTNSVYGYFANTMAGGKNLKTLLDKVKDPNPPANLAPWKEHVVYFPQGNQKTGEPQPNSPTATTDEKSFADNEEAYFMTWRFFVNVVINDLKDGVLSIFDGNVPDDVVKGMGLLMPYGNGESRDKNVAKLAQIDDPQECFIGANKYLRSIDPSTLVIVNEKAAELARKNVQYNIPVTEGDLLTPNDFSGAFLKPTGTFETSAKEYTSVDNPDRGFLSSGVWVNHKAVVKAMLEGDTILRGISNLLTAMNNATMGYWQLALDEVHGVPGAHPQSYRVVDANWRDSSDNAVKNFIKDVHIFNKYIRTKDGELVGSELIDCTIDLSLPKRLFAQIATLGLLSKEDIAKVGAQEAKVGDPQPTGQSEDFSTKISDPNNTLAEMFGIISLSPKDKQSPDLTIRALAGSTNPNGTCGKTNAQLVAGTGGQGYQVADVSLAEALSNSPTEQKENFDTSNAAVNSAVCKQCGGCPPVATNVEASPTGQIFPSAEVFVSTNLPYAQALGTRLNVDPAILLAQTAMESGWGRSGLAEYNNLGGIQKGSWTGPVVTRRDNQAGDVRQFRAYNTLQEFWNDYGSILQRLYPNVQGATNNLLRYTQGLQEYKLKYTESKTAAELASIIDGPYNIVKRILNSGVQNTPQQPAAQPTPSSPPPPTDQVCKSIYEKVGNGDAAKGEEECKRCAKHANVVKQITQTTQTSVDTAVRKFSGFRQAFRYLEVFPELMVASIAADANGVSANAFGASPGSLSIGGDIVLPGINGLRVGELFWIDRVPAFYKVFGAFQVLSIEDTIGTDGWKTKIHARFNYLGKTWKESMVRILT